MLGIVTSLRARELAQDWAHHVWLLDRAVASMLAQDDCEVKVFVVCHEVPESEHLGDPRVRFESVRIAPPRRNNDEMCADKVVKLSEGARSAIDAGCDYVMVSDADDLLSRRVGGVVAAGNGEPGWYSPSELFYRYGDWRLRFYRLPPGQSGPCAIFRSDLLEFERVVHGSPWYRTLAGDGAETYADALVSLGRRVNPVLAAGHPEYRGIVRARGAELLPLPFSGNVVICHEDSTSRVPGGLGSSAPSRPEEIQSAHNPIRWLRRRMSGLRALRLLTRSTVHEFNIPRSNAIPSAYRKGGCVASTATSSVG